jgi:hypothetical protein
MMMGFFDSTTPEALDAPAAKAVATRPAQSADGAR